MIYVNNYLAGVDGPIEAMALEAEGLGLLRVIRRHGAVPLGVVDIIRRGAALRRANQEALAVRNAGDTADLRR